MRGVRMACIVMAAIMLATSAFPQGKQSPDDAYLYFVGLRNMGVTHAGDDFANSGHHHLLIDVNEPLDSNEAIPQDKTHLHFGTGQTEARIELPPGKHTLQLVLGDAKHFPFKPPVVSKKITVFIK